MLTINMEEGRLYVKEYRTAGDINSLVDTQYFYVSGSSGSYVIKHTSDASRATIKGGIALERVIDRGGRTVVTARNTHETYLYGSVYTTREATPEEYAWIVAEHEGFANMFPNTFRRIPKPKNEHYAYY